jgi:hypothetical protein
VLLPCVCRDSVLLLNRLTDVINFWQKPDQSQVPSVQEARARFPDCDFA